MTGGAANPTKRVAQDATSRTRREWLAPPGVGVGGGFAPPNFSVLEEGGESRGGVWWGVVGGKCVPPTWGNHLCSAGSFCFREMRP